MIVLRIYWLEYKGFDLWYCGVDGSNRNGDQERNRKLPPPNGPRSQLPPSLEFPSPNLEVSFPAAICPEWDSGDI